MGYGKEHREERIQATHTRERLRGDHPYLFTISVLVNTWGPMTFRHIALVKEWARKMVRTLPGTVRKGEFSRMALTPMADGRTRWGYPASFSAEHPAGF